MAALSILRSGMFTTVQDLGRWGFQSRGVPVSGAIDWYSHRLANGLVGNEPAMAALEVTLTGPHVRFEANSEFAVTGGAFKLTLDDAPVDMNTVVVARSGALLKFGERLAGARAYVAVAGGIDVPEVLGSRSTHVLTGIGGHQGRALKAGDVLLIGRRGEWRGASGQGALTPYPLSLPPLVHGGARLRIIPVDERLAGQLTSLRFLVSPRSDRMGYRLEGAIIDTPPGELVSTALPTGAVQVPPTGQPILLMNDHATTGGYAIAGTVITADLPLAGQVAPGDWIEFDACTIDSARAQLRQREAELGAE
jgi:antagonist of KipI